MNKNPLKSSENKLLINSIFKNDKFSKNRLLISDVCHKTISTCNAKINEILFNQTISNFSFIKTFLFTNFSIAFFFSTKLSYIANIILRNFPIN